VLFHDISFSLAKGDKVAVLSREHMAITAFFEILMGNETADNGTFAWGSTITKSYLPMKTPAIFR
jgi:ATPase subunit of ABC transporter with duplicated ATPase domains